MRKDDDAKPTFSKRETEGWRNSPAFWIVTQAVSSILLTLLNKSVAMAFPFPFIFLAIQNLSSVVLFVIMSKYNILPINAVSMKQLLMFIPTTFGFVLILWTSLEGLAAVSVSLVVIARNLVPLLTAIVDVSLFGTKISTDTFISLCLVFLGSAAYSLTDLTFTLKGVQWLALNIACVVLIPIIEKRLLSNLTKEQTPTGVTFVRNMLSVPMFLLLGFYRYSVSEITTALSGLDLTNIMNMTLTCIFGFSIGVAYFFLLKLVSNTSIAIANTFYKLITLLASLFIWGLPFDSFDGLIGIALNFVGITWYTYLQQTEQKEKQDSQGLPQFMDSKDKPVPKSKFSVSRVVILLIALACSVFVLSRKVK